MESNIKGLRDSIKGDKDAAQRLAVEEQIAALRLEVEALRQQERDERSAGDRIFWPIYNLDRKNPNAPEAESHDPDVLLEKYQRLLAEITAVQDELKAELAGALLHEES